MKYYHDSHMLTERAKFPAALDNSGVSGPPQWRLCQTPETDSPNPEDSIEPRLRTMEIKPLVT